MDGLDQGLQVNRIKDVGLFRFGVESHALFYPSVYTKNKPKMKGKKEKEKKNPKKTPE